MGFFRINAFPFAIVRTLIALIFFQLRSEIHFSLKISERLSDLHEFGILFPDCSFLAHRRGRSQEVPVVAMTFQISSISCRIVL